MSRQARCVIARIGNPNQLQDARELGQRERDDAPARKAERGGETVEELDGLGRQAQDNARVVARPGPIKSSRRSAAATRGGSGMLAWRRLAATRARGES